MLPISLGERTRTGLIGAGDSLGRRAALLVEAGIRAELLPPDADPASLAGLRLLFIAGLDKTRSHELAACARAAGVLVNVEDVPELCDFHVPAIVRRGELVISVSTGGKAPGLARYLRESLARQFGPEWRGRLEEISGARESWRAEGIAPGEVSRLTGEMIAREGWLA